MYTAMHYVFPQTVEEALALLQKKKSNKIVGGNCWLRLSHEKVDTLIDVSRLGLNVIEEKEEAFLVGAMVSLHQLETHQGLNAWFQDVFSEALEPIVGVQFRNCATVGGSVYSRFGFSDVTTLLAALSTVVCFADGTAMAMEDYLKTKRGGKELITAVSIPKTEGKISYAAFRNTATDLPVLNMAVHKTQGTYKVFVGARPMGAVSAPAAAEALEKGNVAEAMRLVSELKFGTNMRAGASYRRGLASILLERCAKECER